MGSETTVSYSHGTSESSSICYFRKTETLSPQASADMPALTRPIETLRSMLQSPDFNFPSDAKIVVAGNHEIPIHRRILSQRNLFFKNLFYGPFVKGNVTKFEMKELGKDFDVGFDALVSVLDYLYTGKLSPLPEGVCVCVDEECSHVGCRPVVNFMVEVLYTSFTFQIPELLALYERHLLDILENVAIDDILVILCVANTCNKVCDKLLKKCNETVVKSGIDIVTLEKVLPYDIVKQIMDLHLELGLGEFRIFSFPDRPVKRIHRALDSNDVELVRMLLKEEHTILDDAYALHYAVAYCDAETTMELLDLGHADVNHRNPRGYTVLHVAAMREEPAILVSLLIKGARPSDLTPDGKKAVQISKRFTRFVDYNKPIEKGKASPKGWLCIQILEQAERVAAAHDYAGSSWKQLELLLSSIPATDIANLKQQICFMDESMSNIHVLCVAAPNLKENPSSSSAFQPTHLPQTSLSEQLPMSLALLERQCNPSDAASKCGGAAGQGYCSNIWQLGPGMQRLRSFVKVYKSGSMERSIDIARYRGYAELRHNLAREFGIEGQLEDSYSSKWKLVYIDRENDVLHVDGVLPWEAFVSSVWFIKILSSAEFPQENPSYSSEFQSTHLSRISSSVQPLLSSALLERQCNPSDATGRGQFLKISQPGLGMRMRTYTRVLKRGSVGRSIDITRYGGYDELRRDLARMFGIEGQLEASYCSQWRLCYIDHENDILIVGEDPWEEFINCVQSIKILSSAEVQLLSLDGDL